MKTLLILFLALLVTVSLGQITFTREWVKGKRSTTANSAINSKDGHTLCRGLVSAVEYLIELEKARKAECLECCHNSGMPSDIQRTPSDFIPFLRELPGGAAFLEQEPVERIIPVAPSSDRRNQ